jgi:hypothetical protein
MENQENDDTSQDNTKMQPTTTKSLCHNSRLESSARAKNESGKNVFET